MKRKPIFFIMLWSLCLGIIARAQETVPFKIIPEKASPGDEITVVYDPKSTVLSGKKNVNAVVYNYINYKWVAADLKMLSLGDHFEGKYSVPDHTGILAFKFVSDTLTDNANNQGYFSFLFEKNKIKFAPGAYVGWGLARSPKYGQTINDYINFKGISDSATYHWLSQEISIHQSSKSKLAYLYALSSSRVFINDNSDRIAKVLAFLTRKEGTEDDLLSARKIYQNVLRNSSKADSIAALLMQKYPHGALAKLEAYRKINGIKVAEERLLATEKFLAEFPIQEKYLDFDRENFINYNNIYQSIILTHFVKERNYTVLEQYFDVLSFESLLGLYYKLVDISFMKKEDANVDLLALSSAFFVRFEKYRDARPENFEYLSPKEWKKYYQQTLSAKNFGIHAQLLYDAKRYDEAAAYIQQAIAEKGYQNAFFNDVYSKILISQGNLPALKEVLEQSYYQNQVSTDMLLRMKELYIKTNGSEKGYELYLAGLKNSSAAAEELEVVKKKMIKKFLPDFSMKDLNGKVVKLSDLKGKTIVLDFWATWCVPCKASFPGMKLAVEHYKKDPNVVFYFVDTEERGSNYKAEVAKYIKENDFPFQILFDNPMPGGKSTGEVFERISKTFTISGIPQKIFVDKTGNVRFISVGFKGSATGLADEIINMVELTKNAK